MNLRVFNIKLIEEQNSFNFKNIEIQLGQNIWELKLIVHSLEKKKNKKTQVIITNNYFYILAHLSVFSILIKSKLVL